MLLEVYAIAAEQSIDPRSYNRLFGYQLLNIWVEVNWSWEYLQLIVFPLDLSSLVVLAYAFVLHQLIAFCYIKIDLKLGQ